MTHTAMFVTAVIALVLAMWLVPSIWNSTVGTAVPFLKA